MNQHEAPIGTVARIGHPANNILIVKTGVGWRYLSSDRPVEDEAFRSGWDVAPVGMREEFSMRWDGDPKMGGGFHESGVGTVWHTEQGVRDAANGLFITRRPGFRIVRRLVSQSGWETVP